MKFEIRMQDRSRQNSVYVTSLQAENWFAALNGALEKLGETLDMANMEVSIGEDGVSAQIVEAGSGRTFELNVLDDVIKQKPEAKGSDSEEELERLRNATYEFELLTNMTPKELAESSASLDALPSVAASATPTAEPVDPMAKTLMMEPVHLESASGAVPLTPPPTSNTPVDQDFGVEGAYSPGKTGDFLTEAFMQVADLYANYGNDRKAATRYIFELIIKAVHVKGGGLLLTDINNPNPEFWFEHVCGTKADELRNIRLPMNRGVIGYCAQKGVGLNIGDMTREHRFRDDFLLEMDMGAGPVLGVPVQHEQRLRGVFFFFRALGQRPFSHGELNIISYFASTLGEYLSQTD